MFKEINSSTTVHGDLHYTATFTSNHIHTNQRKNRMNPLSDTSLQHWYGRSASIHTPAGRSCEENEKLQFKTGSSHREG